MSVDIGEKIITLRRAQSMSQEALAEKLGVTQAALSRWEHGLRTPDSDHVVAIAETLGVTVAFLEHDMRAAGGVAVHAHMRKQATVKVGDWKRVEAELNVQRIRAAKVFGKSVDFEAPNAIKQFDPQEYSPSEVAQLIKAEWKMPIGAVRNLMKWLESAGVIIVEKDFGTAKIDAMSQWAGSYPVILVNSRLPTDRKRLTLAHELGHLVMHSGSYEPDAENQANEFAAEFLMPEADIKHRLADTSLRNLFSLKISYGVSVQSLFERAYRFGLVTAEERMNFYKTLAKRGWRRNEPESDNLPIEQPTLYRRLIESFNSIGLSIDEQKAILGFSSQAVDEYLFPILSRNGLRLVV